MEFLDMNYLVKEHERTLDYAHDFYLMLTDPTKADVTPFKEEHDIHWIMLIEQALLMFVVTWTYRKLVVAPIAHRILSAAAKANGRRKVKSVDVIKFEQAHLEAIQYVGFAYLGTKVLFIQEWLWPSVQWWDIGNKDLTKGEVFFYTLYAARYTQLYVSLLLEPKRKDFLQMQLHHIVTVVLVGLSYNAGYIRVGLLIMWLMDLADPFLQVGKQFIYVREMKGHAAGKGFFSYNMFADICFGLFAISFLGSRDFLYAYVVYASFAECDEWGPKPTGCRFCLVTLLILQIFWSYLLLAVIKRVLSGEQVNDSRSDMSESESEDTKKSR